ncbi:hypothetical protein O1611_g5901 [Lasiodiplodia mahajangana]|uniref:Uncharacterized protein n=1 Tax=Lasiodiplodia mahajangana TaxID=1108764 RepID=A0ACC2JK11_9PEZI|nr:hypothetical protein O1611_g5901 [Lasiodiplodia mahajangana]
MFTDIWDSVDDFIYYMQQDGVGIGEPIPGTINYNPPPTASRYTLAELDAMGAGVLPITHGLYRSSPFGTEMYLGSDSGSDSWGSVSAITITDYDRETLPLYKEYKPPLCPTPAPLPPFTGQSSYDSYLDDCFDLDFNPFGPGNATVGTSRYLEEEEEELLEVLIEEPEPEGERKHRRSLHIRSQFVYRLQSLKHKFPSRNKKLIAEDNPKRAPQKCDPKPIRKTRKLASRLERLIPPKCVAKGATRFITLLGQHQMPPFY